MLLDTAGVTSSLGRLLSALTDRLFEFFGHLDLPAADTMSTEESLMPFQCCLSGISVAGYRLQQISEIWAALTDSSLRFSKNDANLHYTDHMRVQDQTRTAFLTALSWR
jgi:hypothetical protein